MSLCSVITSDHCDPFKWPMYDGGDVELVVLRKQYEHCIGMPQEADLKRQLSIDLPRSLVHLPNGDRVVDADVLMKATPYSRCCTQAVCAPMLEWFMNAGLFARELTHGYHPLRVQITDCGSVVVTKNLALGMSKVCVGAYVTKTFVVLSSNPFHDAPPPRQHSRGSHRRDGSAQRRVYRSLLPAKTIANKDDARTRDKRIQQSRCDSRVSGM